MKESFNKINWLKYTKNKEQKRGNAKSKEKKTFSKTANGDENECIGTVNVQHCDSKSTSVPL